MEMPVCDVSCLPFYTMISSYSVQGVFCLLLYFHWHTHMSFRIFVIPWLCSWKWPPISLRVRLRTAYNKAQTWHGKTPTFPSSHFIPPLSGQTILYFSFKCWPCIIPALPSDSKLCKGRYHIYLGHHHTCGVANVAWKMVGSQIFAELKVIW